MQEMTNSTIGHYTILQHIARGGMSDIYLARDLSTNQEVALKLVHTSNQEYCQRFQREVRAIASLQHEHILPALDYGEVDSWCYLVTPYVPNGTLRDLMQKGPLTLDETGKYLHQISSALHYAHQQGIIHRDIKPSNILMRDSDFVYLADFGLVKNTRNVAESLTETGFLMGTAEYMAPELAEKDATQFSDIYSLGIVLYQMLTGDVPFRGTTPVGTFMQHLSKQPPRPSLVNPHLPAAFDSLVLRSLAKEPTHRYQSSLELAQNYQQTLHSLKKKKRYANNEETTNLVLSPKVKRLSALHRKRTRTVAITSIALATLAPLLLSSSAQMLQAATINPDTPLIKSITQPPIVPGSGNTPPPSTKTDHPTDTGSTGTPPPQPGNRAAGNNGGSSAGDSKGRASNTQVVPILLGPSKNKSNSGSGNGQGENNRKSYDNQQGENNRKKS